MHTTQNASSYIATTSDYKDPHSKSCNMHMWASFPTILCHHIMTCVKCGLLQLARQLKHIKRPLLHQPLHMEIHQRQCRYSSIKHVSNDRTYHTPCHHICIIHIVQPYHITQGPIFLLTLANQYVKIDGHLTIIHMPNRTTSTAIWTSNLTSWFSDQTLSIFFLI